MEIKLFWIGIVSGIYAKVLRRFLARYSREGLGGWQHSVAVYHGFFMLGAGTLFGGLANSFFNQNGNEGQWMLGGGIAAMVLGILWGYVRAKHDEGAKALRQLHWDLEWADTAFSAIVMASLIMYFVVQAFRIPSGSMRNTFLEGDHLFVNKFVYGMRLPLTDIRFLHLREVTRKDVIVFRFPATDRKSTHYGKDFIKRVVGLPGDVILIRDKVLYVNGIQQTEPYAIYSDPRIYPEIDILNSGDFQAHWEKGLLAYAIGEAARDNFGPVKVPQDCYFVMGDNRDASYDGRFWGPLPKKHLKGKAWFVYWPFKRIKVVR